MIILILAVFLTCNLFAQKAYYDSLRKQNAFDINFWNTLDDMNFGKINKWDLSKKTVEEGKPGVMKLFKKVEPGVPFRRVEGERFLYSEYDNNPACLGVKILFPEMISASVSLIPKETYKLDGYCKKIGFWILGRGRDVDLEIIIKDYLGKFYYLEAGKVDFLGWRYIEINIPPTIPQDFEAFPQKELLEFVGFVFTNNPKRYADELYQPFYVYIDQIEAYLDNYISVYPGIEIKDGW